MRNIQAYNIKRSYCCGDCVNVCVVVAIDLVLTVVVLDVCLCCGLVLGPESHADGLQ